MQNIIGSEATCCGGHHAGKVRLDGNVEERVIYIPHFFKSHQPVEAVMESEVDRLEEAGILTSCDGKQIYHYKGHGVATMCFDPAFLDVKLSLLMRNGTFALVVDGGAGLKLDPKSPHYDPALLEKIRKGLKVTAGVYDISQVILPLTHFPCLADDRNLSIDEAMGIFARGGIHVQKETGIKTIVTSLITTKCAHRVELRWMHVNKGKAARL